MIREKISGISSVSGNWVEIARWNNQDELQSISSAQLPEVNIGDEIQVKQHYQYIQSGVPIPAACIIGQLKEFIEDNLKGHNISQQLAERYGLYGVGLRQIDYDVKCRDTLDSGFEVTIRYRVESLPVSTNIGSIGIAGLTAAVIVLVATGFVGLSLYLVLKEGAAFMKAAGVLGAPILLIAAAAIGVFSLAF